MWGTGQQYQGDNYGQQQTSKRSACRVNHAQLAMHVGKEVRFVGEVKNVTPLASGNGGGGGSVVLESTDGPEVTCQVDQLPPRSKFIEVFAKVQNNLSLKQSGPMIDMGDNIDMKMLNEAICLTAHPKLREYFTLDES